jgi:hypothetical protein
VDFGEGGAAGFEVPGDEGPGGDDPGDPTPEPPSPGPTPTPNQPPTASDDDFTLSRDGEGPFNVLDNDSDPDGDNLTVSIVQPSADGDASVTNNNEITFQPADEFTGETSLTYQVSDGNGGTDTATVTVEVTQPPRDPAPDFKVIALTAEGSTEEQGESPFFGYTFTADDSFVIPKGDYNITEVGSDREFDEGHRVDFEGTEPGQDLFGWVALNEDGDVAFRAPTAPERNTLPDVKDFHNQQHAAFFWDSTSDSLQLRAFPGQKIGEDRVFQRIQDASGARDNAVNEGGEVVFGAKAVSMTSDGSSLAGKFIVGPDEGRVLQFEPTFASELDGINRDQSEVPFDYEKILNGNQLADIRPNKTDGSALGTQIIQVDHSDKRPVREERVADDVDVVAEVGDLTADEQEIQLLTYSFMNVVDGTFYLGSEVDGEVVILRQDGLNQDGLNPPEVIANKTDINFQYNGEIFDVKQLYGQVNSVTSDGSIFTEVTFNDPAVAEDIEAAYLTYAKELIEGYGVTDAELQDVNTLENLRDLELTDVPSEAIDFLFNEGTGVVEEASSIQVISRIDAANGDQPASAQGLLKPGDPIDPENPDGKVFAEFDRFEVSSNGDIAVLADIGDSPFEFEEGQLVESSSGSGIFVWSDGDIEKIVSEGDVIGVLDDTSKKVEEIHHFDFNEQGEIAFSAAFTDGTEGVLKVGVDSNSDVGIV